VIDSRPNSRRLALAACLLAYLALGVVATWPAWIHGAAHTLQCGGCGDVGQEVWFLRWPSAALAHGHDPLLSTFINVPYGVNLMENTSMPLSGLVATPLIWLFGAIASFNVLVALAFATSATACFLAARRFTTSMLAAFAAGLLYGFSPFMIGQGEAHLFLVFGAVPPLMVACLDEILRTGRHRLAAGIVLGALAAAQLLISAEVLLIFGLIGIFGIAAVCIARRHDLRPAAPKVARAFAAAGGIFVALAAFPTYIAFAGPGHVPASVHPVAILQHLSTDVAGIVLPGPNQHFNLGFATTTKQWVRMAAQPGPGAGDVVENGGYLGIPLLALLLTGIARYRKDRIARTFTLCGVIALVFSLGSRLHVGGHFTAIPLPFAVLTHLPLLRDEVAARYTVALWLCVALLVARLGGLAAADWATWAGKAGPRRKLEAIAAFAALGILTVVSLMPAWPYDYQAVRVPPWFSSPASLRVPYGSTVLTYPFPRKPHSDAMLWQAVDGIRYRITAGEAVVAKTRLSATETVFDHCLSTGKPPPLHAKRLSLMRHDLVAFGVSTVVIPRQAAHWQCAAASMQMAIGRPPVLQNGADVWSLP